MSENAPVSVRAEHLIKLTNSEHLVQVRGVCVKLDQRRSRLRGIPTIVYRVWSDSGLSL